MPHLYATGTAMPVISELNPGRVDNPPISNRPTGGQGVLLTEQTSAKKDLDDLLEDHVADPHLAAMARTIARRLSLRRPPTAQLERGTGALVSAPYAYRSDDVDLDRTLEVLAEHPVPEDTDVVVRERMSARRAAVLIVDVSGSMRGEKVRIAAATVAALSADLSGAGDELALVAFWSDAAVVKRLDQPATSAQMLDTLLRIPARGLTNVGFGLSVAHAELARAAARRRTAILLTDAVHNAGPDPRDVAPRFPALHVLLETDGEHGLPLGRDLARFGHGTLSAIRTHRDVAPALNRVLAR
ncbi:VWA domain-containing protein [Amycolatopsis thermoflava]|uniref:von Willebrand factor type A domain-containing protein n=1 Tax=Amycolatopsis thermoflava TaxID=84480 RepID=A0A3N2G7G2_9PSEU|nr:vWA domain-containing protein [Amycolatopsis thermoflava]ROS32149.1 von Willebrand factor type A domain-containing protein [Amycolatopsis thermoflava]